MFLSGTDRCLESISSKLRQLRRWVFWPHRASINDPSSSRGAFRPHGRRHLTWARVHKPVCRQEAMNSGSRGGGFYPAKWQKPLVVIVMGGKVDTNQPWSFVQPQKTQSITANHLPPMQQCSHAAILSMSLFTLCSKLLCKLHLSVLGFFCLFVSQLNRWIVLCLWVL